ncbi:MAG: VOC family protein [Ferruginibacter sp.]
MTNASVNSVHHTAIICSNYEVSKKFYTEVLGFTIKQEIYRKERNSYKLDLLLNDVYTIELFSFPNPPARRQARSNWLKAYSI